MKKNFLNIKQVEFEMNPSYEGRKKILKEMKDLGYENEAEDLEASVCGECLGTGEVEKLTFDKESKEWVVDGTKPCHHLLDEEYL
jgi:hypothetical protein